MASTALVPPRHRTAIIAAIGLVLVVLPGVLPPAAAQEITRPAGATTCLGLSAHADDPDPAGLNLRAGPSTSAPIIGVLKLHAFARDAMGRDLLQAPGFDVIGSYEGWLLVDNFAYPDPPDDPPLPSGPGWVHGSRVLVRSYDEPAPTARLYAQKGGKGASQVIGGALFNVVGCDQRWMRVREHLLPTEPPGRTGWLAAPDICNDQMNRAQVVNVCNHR